MALQTSSTKKKHRKPILYQNQQRKNKSRQEITNSKKKKPKTQQNPKMTPIQTYNNFNNYKVIITLKDHKTKIQNITNQLQ